MDENDFFLLMFGFGSLMGLITLIYVLKRVFSRQGGEIGGWELRGAWARIAAVARTTLAEGIRAKVASGFAALLIISIPIFWFTATGDGTIKGRVQMYISYTLGFAGFILSLLTIFFACRSLSLEIASRQIYSIVSKPIPRWQIVVGKWTGVMIMNLMLLSLAAIAAYGGALLMVSQFKKDLARDLANYGGLTPDQAERTVASLDRVRGIGAAGIDSPIVTAFTDTLGWTRQQTTDILLRLPEQTRVNLRRSDELRRQVLVSRAAISANMPDLTKEADEFFAQLKKEDRLPEGMSEQKVREQIDAYLKTAFMAVGPGDGRQWRLQGPKPDKSPEFIMSIRFKIQSAGQPPGEEIQGKTFEENTLYCLWVVGDPAKSNSMNTEDAFALGTFKELEIPTQSVEDDGTIIISFANIDPRPFPAVFELDKGALQVLYRVGSFELNVFQTWLALLIPLACLAAFGVTASTFLTFPVGTLICITIYVIASSMGFVADALAVTEEYGPQAPSLTFELRKATVHLMDWGLSLGDIDPVSSLIEGRSIGWKPIWTNTWKFVLLKTAGVMLVGVFILRRRELAAVIV